MSWLSSWLDKSSIGKGINAVGGPLVNIGGRALKKIPGVGDAIELAEGLGNHIPGGANPLGGGGLPGGLTAADLLKLFGSAAGGVADYAQGERNSKTAADQFNRNLAQRDKEFGVTSGQRNSEFAANALPGIQRQLNMAPLVDKGAYLAQNRAAPTAFQPRDWTKGINQVQGQATGGPTQQVSANAQAAANYKPGAGGVDSSTLELLKQKMMQQARG